MSSGFKRFRKRDTFAERQARYVGDRALGIASYRGQISMQAFRPNSKGDHGNFDSDGGQPSHLAMRGPDGMVHGRTGVAAHRVMPTLRPYSPSAGAAGD